MANAVRQRMIDAFYIFTKGLNISALVLCQQTILSSLQLQKWQEGCSSGPPNLSRWGSVGCVFFLCWNHLALRSREIPSTGWSRKCCWRTGFSIFRFQISSAFKLVQSSKFILSQQERVGETFATLDSCAQRFKHTSWYCSAALKKIFQVQPQMEAVKWDGPFFRGGVPGHPSDCLLGGSRIGQQSLRFDVFFQCFWSITPQGFLSIFIWIEDVFKFLISWYPPSVQPTNPKEHFTILQSFVLTGASFNGCKGVQSSQPLPQMHSKCMISRPRDWRLSSTEPLKLSHFCHFVIWSSWLLVLPAVANSFGSGLTIKHVDFDQACSVIAGCISISVP